MKDFIEKLISRLEESGKCYAKYSVNTEGVKSIPTHEAISIVNQLAEEYKPMTNADKVKNMNETQLSNLISSACPYEYCYQTDDTTCDLCILEWLHSEVKDGE